MVCVTSMLASSEVDCRLADGVITCMLSSSDAGLK